MRERRRGSGTPAWRTPAGRASITYSRKVFIPLTRLCRDRCHYCTFVTVPGRLRRGGLFLSPDEVARRSPGRARRSAARRRCSPSATGPRTAGRRPASGWTQHGYDTTLAYVRAMAIRVLEETGLLPHLNPGVMSWEEMQRLKPVAPSMGMMLETTSTRLWSEPGRPHFGSPDKDPAVRLRVLEDAGRRTIPFTTGILVGIGETLADRAESLFAIRASARQYGHIQEVIVQNFRAKPDTAMRAAPDAGLEEYLADRRRRPAGARAPDAHPGAAEPVDAGRARPAAARRASTTGAASRR